MVQNRANQRKENKYIPGKTASLRKLFKNVLQSFYTSSDVIKQVVVVKYKTCLTGIMLRMRERRKYAESPTNFGGWFC